MGRGKRIKRLLKARGMTAKELSHKIGCTEAAMSRYVNETRIPKVNEMAKIAAVLGVTIDYLENGKMSSAEGERAMVEEIKDRTCIEVYEDFCGIDLIFAVDNPHGNEAAKVLNQALNDYLETEPEGGAEYYLCRRMDEEIGAIYYQVFNANIE